jgi:hypothetical protein
MSLYKCPKCGKTREIQKITINIVDGRLITPEALCSCGVYMTTANKEGMPGLIRTEPTLTRRN